MRGVPDVVITLFSRNLSKVPVRAPSLITVRLHVIVQLLGNPWFNPLSVNFMGSLITRNLYDRDLFKPLPLTDVKSGVDPYTPEEREIILDRFRNKRPYYFAFVCWQFRTGARPSESIALRHEDLDLRYSTGGIHRSRVQGHESGTKTLRSNREIHLHSNLVEVLRNHLPLQVNPEDYVFTTPRGTPIDE